MNITDPTVGNCATCTMETKNRMDFAKELQSLINRYSQESASDTPDFILARYIIGCLEVYEYAAKARDEWYDFKPFDKTVNG